MLWSSVTYCTGTTVIENINLITIIYQCTGTTVIIENINLITIIYQCTGTTAIENINLITIIY